MKASKYLKWPRFNLKERHLHLLSLIYAHRMKLILAMILMLIVASTTSATAFLIKPILDDIFFKKDIEMLKLLPIVVIFIYVLRAISSVAQAYLMSYVGEKIIQKLRNDLYERIIDLPLAFFQKEKTGVLMSRITNDVNIIKSMVSTAVTGSLRDCFTIVGLVAVIFYRDFQLASFAFIMLPIAFIPFVKYGRRVRRVSTGSQETMADMNSLLHETFSGNKIVKAFCMESFEKSRFYQMSYRLLKLELKAVFARNMSSAVMELLAGVGIAFVIWYGGYRVISGVSTAGTFFSFMAAVLMLYDPLRKLSAFNNSVQEGLAAADRVFDIIEIKSNITECENPIVISKTPHVVTFENVNFGYDRGLILKDINLEVKSGEVVGIVGMSGGGKTSLVNLIPRFFDVTKGCVKIDGTDIKNATIESLRQQIAIVTQEPILFNDSIRNNISYGTQNASEQDIIEAAKNAYAYDFIKAFPSGLDTMIGELGGRLSGGEKQRICIARALLKNAPILILDEATASLDTGAEQIVRMALENLMKGRTSFVIAHRLSTIRYANRIIVMSNGQIVEIGSHDELINLGKEYKKLYDMQFDEN